MRVGNYVRNKYGYAKITKIENVKNSRINRYFVFPEQPKSKLIIVDKPIAFGIEKNGNIKKSNMAVITEEEEQELELRTSSNVLDLLKDGDFIEIEYRSPKYKQRITRIFEVEKNMEDFFSLCNYHMVFDISNKKFKDSDKKLKPVIKSIMTREQFDLTKYITGK